MTVSTSSVNVELKDGLTVIGETRGHQFTIDEPKNQGGSDEGINPVEALLGVLGACKTISARTHAKSQGIHLNNIKIELEGDLDTDGFLDKNPDAKVGFRTIKTTYHVDAENTDQEIEEFVQFVEAHCPVLDTIVNTPEIEVEIK